MNAIDAAILLIFSLGTSSAGAQGSYAKPASQVTPEAWAALNQSVAGRLHIGRPLALPCYLRYTSDIGIDGTTNDEWNSPNMSACDNIQSNKDDPIFIGDNFGGYMSYNFAPCVTTDQDCKLSALLPYDPISPLTGVCSQGGVPSYYVDATGVDEVAASLRWANEQNVRLVIKNTGHDYRGRSTGPDSFAIWTHHIKPQMVIDDNFIPDGCPESTGPVVTYGAGEQFQELNDFVYQNKYTPQVLIGGAAATVGASGGWILGGGHSFASNTYGLGVDNVMQMRVVLPNGTYVTANRCQHQDIFFALRGGGGGTFGVLMETTSRLYPIVPMQLASIYSISFAGDNGRQVLRTMIENAVKWADDGWGGYVGPDYLSGSVVQFSLATPKLTLEEAKESMKPLTDLCSSLGNDTVPIYVSISTLNEGYKEYLETPFIKAFTILNNVGLAPASRLIPQEFFEAPDKQETLLDALTGIIETGEPNSIVPYYVLFVPPHSYQLPDSDIPPNGPGAASVSPAWRKSIWHVFAQTFWDPIDPTASLAGNVTQAFSDAHHSIDVLRQMAPDSGAYQNEADPFEPDWIGTFWGQENYDRLLQIKREIDPNNIMTCLRCVGYDESDPRYMCYPQI
ncbi:hypothetical protein N0V82_002643 [Gnomoniopsis sp. IMI 355080]|nr:hypothetical protein N0V82_002643 [Gnomoniopsis sp. IMI 355080]